MPSIAAHMIIAKLVSDKLNINDKEFIKGNLLPDVIDDKDSHHKYQSDIFLVPNLDYFKDNLDLLNKKDLGYYTHLLLDYYYLEEYIPKHINNLNIFIDGTIYNEYDYINYELLNNFNIDVKGYTNILNELYNYPNIDIIKLEKNINCLNNTKAKESEYLKVDDFSAFLKDISDRISKEVKEYED